MVHQVRLYVRSIWAKKRTAWEGKAIRQSEDLVEGCRAEKAISRGEAELIRRPEHQTGLLVEDKDAVIGPAADGDPQEQLTAASNLAEQVNPPQAAVKLNPAPEAIPLALDHTGHPHKAGSQGKIGIIKDQEHHQGLPSLTLTAEKEIGHLQGIQVGPHQYRVEGREVG